MTSPETPPSASPPHDADPNDLGFDLPPPKKLSPARLVAMGAVGVAILAAAFVIAWLPKRAAEEELRKGKTEEQASVTRVQVVAPKVVASDKALRLSASVMPLEQTTVYARVPGYVRKWHVDLGDKVTEGQLMAEIDTPETDQQLAQGRAQLAQVEAQLAQAKANRGFSSSNLDRYAILTPQGVATKQDLEQKQAQLLVDEAAVKAGEAAINAQQANVRRLVETKSFARITAPFAGTVNARTIERGSLASTTTPLFRLSSSDPVRVMVDVPQNVAPAIATGLVANLTVREYGARKFEGKVARSSGVLDPQVRTMKTEIRIPNPKGELIPGMYGELFLSLPTAHEVLEIPSTALSTDASGVRVATVTPEGTIHLVPVVIERDTGAAIELASGLTPGSKVVKLFSVALVEGKQVEVVP